MGKKMQIDVYMTYANALERRLRERSVVVIDVLRSTTTIVEAMANGAINVLPAIEIDEAIALSRSGGSETLLAGERFGKPVDGFALGNSPQDFTASLVQGKSLVLTTTNGTAALNHVRNSNPVLIGALRNRMALAQCLVELGLDVALVCAGTEGQFSADDFYCAGSVIAALEELHQDLELTDLGQLAELYYKCVKQDPALLHATKHYRRLAGLGLSLDLSFCFEEDVCNIVPRLVNGIIEL